MNGGELLKALGGLRAAGKTPGGAGAVKPLASGSGTLDFAKLLAQAREGEVSSHAPVQVGKGAKFTLSEGQLETLAKLADQAEAQGATKALCLIGGEAYSLDVATRTITGKVDISKPGVNVGFDAVLVAPGGGATGSKPLLLPPKATGGQLAQVLGAARGSAGAA